MELSRIHELLANEQYDKALSELDSAIADAVDSPLAEQLYLLRGRTNWNLNRRGPAVTDYEHALALNPGSAARVMLDNARSIEDFFNPDLLNP